MNADQSAPTERWASGTAYETYVGRWSRLIAREFVKWLNPPAGWIWLDVGPGTGALSRTILDRAEPRRVTGVERSTGYAAFCKDRMRDDRARFGVGDAMRLPLRAGSHDAVVSGLVLNFIPEPGRAVAEMARTTRPGGLVAAYVWDYAGGMELMRYFWDAAAALDPIAHGLDEGRRFPICQPAALRDLFRGAGLEGSEVRPIDIQTEFGDFDDYWKPFLGGDGPAPGYVRSLSAERLVALRESLQARLPIRPDGSISLSARAWAVRAVPPSHASSSSREDATHVFFGEELRG